MTIIMFPGTKPAQPQEPPLRDDPYLREQIRQKCAAVLSIADKPMSRSDARRVDFLLQQAGCDLTCMHVLDNLP